MAVTRVGAGTKVVWDTGSPTFVVVPLPLGVAEGDLVVLYGITLTGSGEWIRPSVWTLQHRHQVFPGGGHSGPSYDTQMWTRYLGPDPDDHVSVSFTHPMSNGTIVAVAYRGVTQTATQHSDSSLVAPAAALPGVAGGVAVYGWAAATTSNALVEFDAPAECTAVVATAPRTRPLILADQPIGTGNVAPSATATRNSTHALYSVTSVTLALGGNVAPNAPILLSPPNGSSFLTSATQRYRWQFSDPDPDDIQSRWELWLENLTTHTLVDISHIAPSTFADINFTAYLGGLPAGDYSWQVRTWDAAGAEGPFSEQGFFTLVDAIDAPTITYPIGGGTVAHDDRVDWSYPDQDAYQVRRVADDVDGNPDTGTVYFDSGEVDAADARTAGLTFPTNDRYEHIQVRVHFAAAWSDWVDVRVLVSYTAPPVGTLQVLEGDDGASIALAYTVPAAGEGVPTATSADIRVSADGGATYIAPANLVGLTAAPDEDGYGSATYWLPLSGTDYCFQIVTRADNGAAAESEWISLFRLTIDEVV